MAKEKTHHVYLLVDPRDRLPYYVGRTSDPDRRLAQHCDPKKDPLMRASRRSAEIIEQCGRPPHLVIVESHAEELSALTGEIFWIDLLSCRGATLLNSKGNRWWLLRKAEALSRPRGRRHGQVWTEADENALCRYRDAKLSTTEMAILLGRSERSVRMTLEKLSKDPSPSTCSATQSEPERLAMRLPFQRSR